MQPLHGRQAAKLREEFNINYPAACNDLLDPVLRTLWRYTNEPWEYLPGGKKSLYQLPGLDNPYVEMLMALDKVWRHFTKHPLHFTYVPQKEGTRKGRYELIRVQNAPANPGYLTGIEWWLHWRLTDTGTMAREYQRLALLGLSLLDYILIGGIEEGFHQGVSPLDQAYNEYFELLKADYRILEPQLILSTRKAHLLPARELAALREAAATDSQSFELCHFLEEFGIYSETGPAGRFTKTLKRYRRRFYGKAGEYSHASAIRGQWTELVKLYDELYPTATTAMQRAACELAQIVENLYAEWPTEHERSLPTLYAYSQDSEYQKDNGGLFGKKSSYDSECVLQFYQLPWSLETQTGQARVEFCDSQLNYTEIAPAIHVTSALPDGTLPLGYDGGIDPDHAAVLPFRFCEQVSVAMEAVLNLDKQWALDLGGIEGAYSFCTWFDNGETQLRHLLARWKDDTLDRLTKNLGCRYAAPPLHPTLLDILGPGTPGESEGILPL